jgi:hypothetical protein
MKYVRTARGYQSLKLDDELTVDGTLQEVSNDNADKLAKAGDEYGVPVLVFDSEDEAREALGEVPFTVGSRTPDLSEGVAAVTGRGAPVQTFGGTPDDNSPPPRGAGDKNQEK